MAIPGLVSLAHVAQPVPNVGGGRYSNVCNSCLIAKTLERTGVLATALTTKMCIETAQLVELGTIENPKTGEHNRQRCPNDVRPQLDDAGKKRVKAVSGNLLRDMRAANLV